jgi:hypothetical protein
MDLSTVFNAGANAAPSFDWGSASSLPSLAGSTAWANNSAPNWSGGTGGASGWAFPPSGFQFNNTNAQQPSIAQSFLQNFLKGGIGAAQSALGGTSMSDIAKLAGVPAAMSGVEWGVLQGMQIPIAKGISALDRNNNLRRAEDQAAFFSPASRAASRLDGALEREEGVRNLAIMFGPNTHGRTWAEVLDNPGGTVTKRGDINMFLGGKQITGSGFKYV